MVFNEYLLSSLQFWGMRVGTYKLANSYAMIMVITEF